MNLAVALCGSVYFYTIVLSSRTYLYACFMAELLWCIWQSSSGVFSLYLSVIRSLAEVVGIKQLLMCSSVNNLLQHVVHPAVRWLMYLCYQQHTKLSASARNWFPTESNHLMLVCWWWQFNWSSANSENYISVHTLLADTVKVYLCYSHDHTCHTTWSTVQYCGQICRKLQSLHYWAHSGKDDSLSKSCR